MDIQLGLIGFPIKHSLSPWIHAQLLDQAHLDGEYHLLDLNTTVLNMNHINYIKSQGLLGFNVTVPFKESIIPFLDKVDIRAEGIGAVNTVFNQNGIWTGYNTDGIGYLRAVRNGFPYINNDKSIPILIIGAGGAAKGIFHALIEEGFTNVDIANRTIEHAEDIARIIDIQTQTECITLQKAEEQLEKYKLVIQTTVVGMEPNNDKTIINLENLSSEAIVSDIVYQPLLTKFLLEAKQKGASIHCGHTMLINQALYAFEIWTDKKVQLDGLANKLKYILEGK